MLIFNTYLSLQFNTGNSWWPLFMSFSIFILMMNFLNYVNNNNLKNLLLSLVLLFMMINLWYRDLHRESYYMGSFNLFMQMTFKMGMVLFILSEFMFFFSFFWTYFHFMFMFDTQFGLNWPPESILTVNYMSIPLLNTLLLLSSGASLTLSHNFYLLNNKIMVSSYLIITIMLGFIFTFFQLFEYYMMEFLWSESVYGSIFYMGTGFHGLHVLIGSIMLFILLIKSLFNLININSTFFDLASWYWHFVDMIWLLLFTEFYWWSSH